MKRYLILLFAVATLNASSQDTSKTVPGPAVYAELLGKGFGSVNVDFAINQSSHRIGVGLTMLDYELGGEDTTYVGPSGIPTLSAMYYYLHGKGPHYFELGAGLSVFHKINAEYVTDSPYSLHGVIGYRYQKPNGLLFRAGFTPFKRINDWFLPLVGVSLGYSF